MTTPPAKASGPLPVISMDKRSSLYRKLVKLHGRRVVDNLLSVLKGAENLNDELRKLEKLVESLSDDSVRRRFFEWRLRTLPEEVSRAVREAERRFELLVELAENPSRIHDELIKIKADVVYWTNTYAMTVDPRHPLFLVMPFSLFPYQEEMLRWLWRHLIELRTTCLVEKSRDVGATWLGVVLFGHRFLFDEVPYQLLAMSRTASETDTLGDVSTLFEKWRALFRNLPSWQLPAGFDERHMPYMRITHPTSGAFIVGSASSRSARRGGRFSCVWLDEFAHIAHDADLLTAVQQTSTARLFTSTPNGNANEFYRLRFSGSIPVYTAHWSSHPFRGREWYEYQRLELDDRQTAQELDIDYLGSGEGRVFSNWSEPHSVITWSEFENEIGVRRIPQNWERVMGHDWGMTESHRSVCVWVARAPEGAKTRSGRDISGCLFVYRELVAPTGSTPDDIAEMIKLLEWPGEDPLRVMSHEALTERSLYAQHHGLIFLPYKGKSRDNISKLNVAMRLIDSPHPFRPALDKSPRIFFVSDDGQGELVQLPSGVWGTKAPKTHGGLMRLRQEIPVLQYKKGSDEPVKEFDDAVDALKMACSLLFRPVDLAQKTRVESEEEERSVFNSLDGEAKAGRFLAEFDEGGAFASGRFSALWGIKSSGKFRRKLRR